MCVWVCVLLTTSTWGLSKLQGGYVPTADIDQSKLGSLAYCYIAYLLNPAHPLFLPSDVCLWEASHCCPSDPATNVSLHGITLPPKRHRSLSQHPNFFPAPPLTHDFQSPTPPPQPFPRHTWRIPIAAASLLLTKYILTWTSAAACRHHGSQRLTPSS